MKTLLFCLMIVGVLGFGHNTWAAWEKIGVGQQFTHYVDRGTKVFAGDLVKMWVLDDYKTAQVTINKKSFFSFKQHFEFDCAEKKGRGREAFAVSGAMGHGNVVWSDASVEPWRAIVQGTMLAEYWTLACGVERPQG